ncbi:ATP-binding cassette sub-family G member 1-like [Rhodnius prolixus]|uniref:Putative abc transporter n=1 Tax=Rhodnius neglectus TaxID=72488 RepID=A0A0P4VY32_9HEMI
MDIEFDHLTFTVDSSAFRWGAKKRTLLKSISGRFRAGELSAILGPSGAGKSSLLNALSGYRSCGVSGQLKLNGQPRDEAKFKKMSCYITQEDLLVPLLSLQEVMCFAASLKLPPTYSRKEKHAVVEEVQNMLGLADCKYTRTELLSGGQKKRLSIALELINNPPIFFLDEPTSGLDNVSTSNLLKILRCLAHQGRTVVCTIHQPSASLFTLFDNVYVMAAGLCVYQGAPQEMLPFIRSATSLSCPTHYNPADYVIELTEVEDNITALSKAIENGKLTKFKRLPNKVDFDKQHYTQDVPMKNHNSSSIFDEKSAAKTLFTYGRINDDFTKGTCSDFSVSCWTQFFTLLSRMLLQVRRNKVGLQIQLYNHLGCSLALGIMFYQMAKDGQEFFNHMKFCIGVIVFHTYTQCMVPILAYPFEVKLLKKEHFNQWYGLCPYYLALTFSKVPTITFFSLLYLTIVYTLSGLPYELDRFLVFCTVGVTVAFVAEGMGLMIGSVFSVTNGAAVGPLSIAPFLGLAIYGFDFARAIPSYMWPMIKSSFMRSGVIALIISVFGMNREMLECSDPVYCHFQDPKVTLHYLALEDETPWHEIRLLLVMLVVFRLAFYLGLKWRLRT